MKGPRKRGKQPYPTHRYAEGMFDPHSSPCWLVGNQDEEKKEGDRPGTTFRSTALSAVSLTSLREL